MINQRFNFIGKLKLNQMAAALTVATWTLPAVTPAFMGLQIFAPLPAFYYLVESGRKQGLTMLALALLCSATISILLGQFGAIMFTLLMLPAGVTLAQGATSKEFSPGRSGLNAFVILLVGWLLWAAIYGISQPGSPSLYGDIVSALDKGLVEVGKALKDNTQLASEQALEVEATVARLRVLLPRVMPGLLLVTMLNTVFFNMVVGQYLLRRKNPDLAPWPPFATWRLPEPLVALVIVAGFSLLMPVEFAKSVGMNLLLVAGTLYFFQGLALLTSLLNRWSVPGALRFLIFLLVLVQAYGIIVLAVAGLVDVWIDIRKPRPKPENFED